MENKTLTDPAVKPDNNVLEAALGKNYRRFTEFAKKAQEMNLVLEWHYYLDGKSWLCKVLNKKKNLCWLSVWDTGFKLTFYFTEKTMQGMYDLDIDEDIKKAAAETESTGKLRPVKLSIKNGKMLKDAMKILEYKKQLK